MLVGAGRSVVPDRPDRPNLPAKRSRVLGSGAAGTGAYVGRLGPPCVRPVCLTTQWADGLGFEQASRVGSSPISTYSFLPSPSPALGRPARLQACYRLPCARPAVHMADLPARWGREAGVNALESPLNVRPVYLTTQWADGLGVKTDCHTKQPTMCSPPSECKVYAR